MSKHTEGEWKWYGDELLSDKHFILSCGKNGRPSKADGDLIKAAPDLLDLATAILSAIEMFAITNTSDEDTIGVLSDAAREVIDKAQGAA